MRALFHLFSLAALASTGVFATPVPECLAEICGSIPPVNSGPSPANFAASIAKVETPTRSLPQSEVEQLSNAERFVRGLPPKRPKLVQGSSLRRSQSSPVPCKTYRGIIRVDNIANGATLGYLSPYPENLGYTRYSKESDAFIVSFKIDANQDSGSAFGMTIEPDMGGFSDLGLVQGRDDANSDISPGSFHYLYVSGIAQTPPGSTPQNVGNAYDTPRGITRTSESVVWTFNSATNEIACQWVNTDGSKPTTKMWTQSTGIFAGADPAAFHARYPAPVTDIKLTFIPNP